MEGLNMSATAHIGSGIVPLPTTREGLLAQRKTNRQRTLNDYTEEAHVTLWENEKYRAYLNAVNHAQAVEGSMRADDFFAVLMIREWANGQEGYTPLKTEKAQSILESLKVVMKRYCMSRYERAVGFTTPTAAE